jgi:hypothetical protein
VNQAKKPPAKANRMDPVSTKSVHVDMHFQQLNTSRTRPHTGWSAGILRVNQVCKGSKWVNHHVANQISIAFSIIFDIVSYKDPYEDTEE